MNEHDTDAVLLTRDVTKGDWLKFDKTPYVHYLVNAYELTGHLLYILDVDDFIPMTFESIAEEIDDDDEIPEKPTSQDNVLVNTDLEEDDDNPFEKFTLKPESIEMLQSFDWSKFDLNRKYYDTTPDQFIAELRKAQKWSSSYSDGYVGENYFIYRILGNKKYKFGSSKKVLDDLITAHIVERQEESHDGHWFNCLVLKEE